MLPMLDANARDTFSGVTFDPVKLQRSALPFKNQQTKEHRSHMVISSKSKVKMTKFASWCDSSTPTPRYLAAVRNNQVFIRFSIGLPFWKGQRLLIPKW